MADDRVSTHWTGCWRVHHDCAISIIESVIDGAIDEAEHRLGIAHNAGRVSPDSDQT